MNSNTDIKILVADDEALARNRIVSFLEEQSAVFTILEATNGKETIEALVTEKPQLLFLDIKMTDMSGFEVLQKVSEEFIPIVIFVTAFNDFAVQAFEVQAVDFLLKPYKKDRLSASLNRGLHQLELSNQAEFRKKLSRLITYYDSLGEMSLPHKSSYLKQVVLKSKKKYLFVAVETIIFMKSSSYYAEIFTTTKERHLHRISLTEFIQQLDPTQFSRINRSTIVNMQYVKEVVSEGLGDFSVVMKDHTTFNVSKGYKTNFLKQMGIK